MRTASGTQNWTSEKTLENKLRGGSDAPEPMVTSSLSKIGGLGARTRYQRLGGKARFGARRIW
jgi:hypothetical protein